MSKKINTLIGSDISIIGNVTYEGIVHVEGDLKGSLTAIKDKESKLYINKLSTITGYVDASNVAIDGKVLGNVYAYELLQLGSNANIQGDIYYKSLEMEVGAKVDGRLINCSNQEDIDHHKLDIESAVNSTTINDS